MLQLCWSTSITGLHSTVKAGNVHITNLFNLSDIPGVHEPPKVERGVSNRWTGFSTGMWDWNVGLEHGTGMWDWNL